VADGYHLWSETYDRTLEDIFAVQDDIAQSVVKELRATLLGEDVGSDARGEVRAEVAKAARGRGTSPEAHRLFLLARYVIDRSTREDTAKAIGYLRQALALDAGFALAWAELGGAYAREANNSWAPVAEGYARAREAVARSLALEPELAEGHAQLGWIRMFHDWDWRGAEASYARALELAPGNVVVLRGVGVLAGNQGRLEEEIGLIRRVLQQDPLSAAAYHNLGITLHAADRFAEAEEAYRKTLELTPQAIDNHALLAQTLLALGRAEEALVEAQREPLEALRLSRVAIIHHAMGHRTESDAALREMIEKCAERAAYEVAEVHAVRGEADAAFEWLERAYARRQPWLTELKGNPHFRSLHGDQQWGAFLKKMGFNE